MNTQKLIEKIQLLSNDEQAKVAALVDRFLQQKQNPCEQAPNATKEEIIWDSAKNHVYNKIVTKQ